MKYRKKPVVIEAVQFTGSNFEELGRFAGQCVFWLNDKCLGVRTLEDGPNGEAKHVADQGDWIIRGVKGEHYACKPDIFAMTYEPADARGEAEGRDAKLKEAISDAAYEWQQYVSEDSAPHSLVVHMERAFDAALSRSPHEGEKP
jgi:hypothetical protein